MPDKPRKGESRSTYVSRLIKYFRDVENRSQEESIGRAEGFADSYWGKTKQAKSKKHVRTRKAGM